MVTSDPTISGSITYGGGSVDGILIEVDLDGDGTADDTLVTDSSGGFMYDGTANLTAGQVTIGFRPVDPGTATGSWESITFTWQGETAEVSNLQLVNDTGISSTDNETDDGTVSGTVTNDGSVSGMLVEVDLDNNGTADDCVFTDSLGNFVYDATNQVPTGSVTIQFRPVEVDPNTEEFIYGDWESITFTLTSPPPPQITNFDLANDTGDPDDNSTTDPTVSGQLTGEGPLSNITVSFDLDGDGITDVTTVTDSYGAFSIDLSSYLTCGSNTVNARVDDGMWSGLLFEYVEA